MGATNGVNRRGFVATAAASTAAAIVPRHVLGGAGYVAPNDKITLAHIGMGTQGFRELGALLDDPRIQIVAVCDPNEDSNDYIEWGKNGIRNLIRRYLGDPHWREGVEGCPGGREVGRLVVETYYTKTRQVADYKGCRSYADFRELLEQEKDLDAIKVMTPDHLHGPIAVAAMKKGIHVAMHKPLANRLHECRLVVETARKSGVATHLLAYGAAPDNRRVAAAIQKGVIGQLREIHNWSNRPVWPQYAEIPKEPTPIPPGFDWQLWLGPAVDRPYHPCYTHTVFRGWYDFGGGSMADMGIYSLWPVFEQLQLGVPIAAEGWGTHQCTITENLSRVIRNDYSYPIACSFRFCFAPREEQAGIELYWYDGGMKPPRPDILKAAGVRFRPEGIMFVGENGVIVAGFQGQDPVVFTNGKRQALWELMPADSLGQPEAERRGIDSWIRACQGGPPSPGNFVAAADVSDTVNLGTVALRAQELIEFDSAAMKVTNVASANKYIYREYRPGWEM